jgi:ribokinase
VRVEGGPIVAVIGAINEDLVVSGASLPTPGETVTGGVFAQHHGGKGGNQSVAAARGLRHGHMLASTHNARPGVWMLGAVGDDQLGVAALEALRADDVQTDHVLVTPDAPTGVALIAVGPDGQNLISVAPGANLALSGPHVVGALESVRPHVLLVSLEVPEAAVRAGMEWARDHGTTVVLNPAPPQPWAPDLVRFATYVTPNEHELTGLGDVPETVIVIETRGAEGALIHGGDGIAVPAPAVDVVDTTGAGDCFNGVLAAALVGGVPMRDAVTRAVVAASMSVMKPGAREGIPTVSEIDDALQRHDSGGGLP